MGEQEWIHTLATEVDKTRIVYEEQTKTGRRLAAYLRERKRCDLVVALTHMRIPNDEKFARELHDCVDLVLGGHDHTDYYSTNRGLFFAKSGTDFRMFTQIEVMFFSEASARARFRSALEFLAERVPSMCPASGEMFVSDNGKEMYVMPSKHHPYIIRAKKVMVSEVPGILSDPTMSKYISGLVGELDAIEAEQVGVTAVALDSRFSAIRTRSTNVTCFLADLILRETGTDFVIINCGTLRADALMPAGAFCRREINQLLPMHDPLAKLKLTGHQLLLALENGVSAYPKLEGRWPMIAGLRFAFDAKRPPHSRILK